MNMTNVKIYNVKKHSIYEDKMEVLLNSKTNLIAAIGNECETAVEKNIESGASPSDFVHKELIYNYRIVDKNLFEKVLKFLVRYKTKADIKRRLFCENGLVIAHISFVDETQKRDFEDAIYAAGFGRVFIIDDKTQGITTNISYEDFVWEFCKKNKIGGAVEFFY